MCVGQHQGVNFPMLNHGGRLSRRIAIVVKVENRVVQRKPRTDRSLRGCELGCGNTWRRQSRTGSQALLANSRSSHVASRTKWKGFISHQYREVAL